MTLGNWKANFSPPCSLWDRITHPLFHFFTYFLIFKTFGIILLITSSDNFQSSLCVLMFPARMYRSQTYYQNAHCSLLSFLIKYLYWNNKHIWWLTSLIQQNFQYLTHMHWRTTHPQTYSTIAQALGTLAEGQITNPSLNLKSNKIKATKLEMKRLILLHYDQI